MIHIQKMKTNNQSAVVDQSVNPLSAANEKGI
jgi:hypothetical protein